MTLPKRLVLDTNVIFEGLTSRDGSCGLIIDAALADMFDVYISVPLLYEYDEVLTRKLSPRKLSLAAPLLGRLIEKAKKVKIYFRWRPLSPDPDDDMVIECAIHVSATIITSNVKDFRSAQREFGIEVLRPSELVDLLLYSGE